MAITFLEKRKRLQYLFPILGIVILITFIVLWQGFFKKSPQEIFPAKETTSEILPEEGKKIEIDFEFLKSPKIEELQIFEKNPPYEGEIGRENPFIPY